MIAFVAERAKVGGSATTFAFTPSAGFVVGNHWILVIHIPPPSVGSIAVQFVADSVNTWQIDAQVPAFATGNTHGIAICSCRIDGAPFFGNVIVTLTGSSPIGLKLEEYSGLHPTAWFDKAVVGQAVASVNLATSALIPVAGALLVAGFGPPTNEASFTPGGSYVQAGTPRNASPEVAIEYLLGAAGSSQNATGTVPTAGFGSYAHILASYLPTNPSGSGTNTLAVVQRTIKEARSDVGKSVEFNTQKTGKEARADAGKSAAAVTQITQRANRADSGRNTLMLLGPPGGEATVDRSPTSTKLTVIERTIKEARADAARNTLPVTQRSIKEARADKGRPGQTVTQKAGAPAATVDQGRSPFTLLTPLKAAGVNTLAVAQRNIKQAVGDDDVPAVSTLVLTGGESGHVAQSGRNVLAGSQQGLEQLADATRNVGQISQLSQRAATNDAGSNALVGVQLQQEAPADSGVSALAVSPGTVKEAKSETTSPVAGSFAVLPQSPGDRRTDTGVNAQTVTQQTIREARADLGLNAETVTAATVREAPSDSGRNPLAGVPREVRSAVKDTARNTLAVVQPFTARSSGVNVVGIAQLASGRRADAGVSRFRLTGGEAHPADVGTNAVEVAQNDGGWGGPWGDAWGDPADPQAIEDQGRNVAVGVQRLIKEAPRDATRNVFVVTAPNLRDSGRNSMLVSQKGSEQGVDQGRSALTVSQLAVEAARDSGRNNAQLSPSPVKEARGDSGRSSLAVSQPSRDARSDSGVNAFSVNQPTFATVQSGTNTLAVSQKATDRRADSGRSALAVSQLAVSARADQGLNAPAIIARGVDAPADSGRSPVTVTQPARQAASDSGRNTLTVVPRAVDREADSGRNTLTVTPSGADARHDTGRNELLVTQTAIDAPYDKGVDVVGLAAATVKEAVAESDPNAFTITDSLRLTDRGRNTLLVDQKSAEAVAQAARNTLALVSTSGRVPDQGVNTVGVVPAPVHAAVADAARNVETVTQPGSHGAPHENGLNTVAVVQAEVHAHVRDSGRNTLAVVEQAAAARADSGRSTLGLIQKQTEKRADLGLNTETLTAGPSHGARSDRGVNTSTVTQQATEATAEHGKTVMVLESSSDVARTDAGTNAATIAARAVSQLVDVGLNRLPVTQPSKASPSDAGQSVIGVTPLGVKEARSEHGRATLTVAQLAAHSATGDTGRGFLFSSQAGKDAPSDRGEDDLTLVPSGVLVPSAHGRNVVGLEASGRLSIHDSGVNTFTIVELQGPVIMYRVGARLHPRWKASGRQVPQWRARPAVLTHSLA